MPLSEMYAGGGSPFSNALSNFMQAKQMAQTNRLMAPAMSGDLSALNELMSVNPQAGMQVQGVMSQRQQAEQQARQQAEQQQYMRGKDAVQLQLDALKAGAQYDPQTGQITQQAPGAFQFEGGLTADMMNLISQAEANPAIKQTPQYKLAIAQLGKPQYIQTEQGTMQIPGLDVASVLSGRQPSQQPAGMALPGTEKTAPMQKEYTDKWQAREKINSAANRYKEILDELGPQIAVGPLNAKDQTRLASAYTKLQLEAKTAAELGALSGPDLGLVEKWIPDPTSLAGAAKGKEALMGGLGEYMAALEDDQKAFETSFSDLNVKTKPLTKLSKPSAKKSAVPADIQDILKKHGTAK